jgi:hypothetical protein
MRPSIVLLLLAALAAPARAGDLVVHEWGTFTSVQGSSGVTLEGLEHEEEGLPAFVYSRSAVRACPLRDRGFKGLECDVSNVTEKMETPVTYFYSGRQRHLRVRVCFRNGLLSQWFPVVDKLGPAEGARGAGRLDMAKVEKSFLEWDLDVLPPGEGADAIPPVGKDDPWRFARLPDSNCVRTAPRVAPRAGPVETEKFLFYRGLGRFTLPIRVEADASGRLTIHNDGDAPIGRLFVLEVRDGCGEFAEVAGPGAHETVSAEPERARKPPSVDAMIERLRPALERALVAEGLYPKEAEAMVKTWERSYFRTEGLRIFYLVPERLTNELLPISIEPPPCQLKRVLVGRLECVTPLAEKEVADALIMRRNPRDAEDLRRAEARLGRLGRFAEPHVRAVLANRTLAVAHEAAREWLDSQARKER